jgi:hypothetical protein
VSRKRLDELADQAAMRAELEHAERCASCRHTRTAHLGDCERGRDGACAISACPCARFVARAKPSA